MKKEKEIHLDINENQLKIIKRTILTKICPQPRQDASLFTQMENRLRRQVAQDRRLTHKRLMTEQDEVEFHLI